MTAQAGDTFLHKQTLRRELRARRLSLSAAERRRAAERAAHHGFLLLRAMAVRRVALYLATGGELSTAPLVARLHKNGVVLAVPRTLPSHRMVFEQWRPDEPLRRRRHGIREPARHGRQLRRNQFDAVLLPLLGFDERGGRLGAGGGYYDRWLARPRVGRRPLYIGYAYAVQEVGRIPCERWDARLDAVITEQGVRWLTG